MAIKQYVVASFRDEDQLLPAVKKVRMQGYKLYDVFTPFPVHGLDAAMGLRQTALHTAGFIYGALGTATALLGMSWIFVVSWPLDIGGKPHFPLPSFIPITFELTVLFSAVGTTLTFCWLNQIMPGVKKHIFHPRQSDDRFVMAIEVTPKTQVEEVKQFLLSNGAEEVQVQTAEEGWWYGLFSKREKYDDINPQWSVQ